LWKILLLEKEASVSPAQDAQTRIESSPEGGLIAVLFVNGREVNRKPIALAYKEGYLFSNAQTRIVPKFGGRLNFYYDFGYGVALSSDNHLFVAERWTGTMLLGILP